MSCNPECIKSKKPHWDNEPPYMVSMSEKGRFPYGKTHPQCGDCMLLEAELAIMFNNDQKMIDRYKKLKNRHEN